MGGGSIIYPIFHEDLGNVTISLNGSVVLNNTTTIYSLSGTIGTASGIGGGYSDFTAFGPYAMYPGSTYSFSLRSIDLDESPDSNSMAIYIDYNRNGVFTDVGERVHTASALTYGPHTETGTFTIPASAVLGFTRMRVICTNGGISSPSDLYYYGEYEDYSLDIGGTLISGLPTGVTASWANNTITISGTPTISGTFNHSIRLAGGCGTVNATGTITVNPVNVSVGDASSTQTPCINTSLTNITHTTTGATGIGTATGLPTGVTALWANNKITISGTPTVLGTFNYSIPLVGGCGSGNAIGTITVRANNTTGVASGTPTLCINTSLTNITHTTTGATGIGTATGLPTGVTASWANNTITVSGTPTISGTFSYSIPLVGGCSSVNATGLITVLPKNIIEGLASSTPRLCINTAFNVITHNTTGATGIGSPNYLPPTPVLYPTNSYDLRSVAISLNGSNVFYNATNINSLSGTIGTAVGTAGSYSDFTAFRPYNIFSGSTYLLSLTSITDSDPYNPGYNNMAAYIDYNRNGVFTDDGEKVYASGGPTIGSNTQNVQFFVPTSASPGLTRMRVLCTAISYVGYIDPTYVGNYGEFEDYSINIDGFASWPVGPGVTASWANNKITISGTPTTSGTYNYAIPLAGGCGNERATGTITVITTDMTAGTASSTPSLCINTSLTDITHTTSGATGIGTPTGLPTGVTASWANNTITISGAPSTSGTFNYSIPLTGGSCGSANATGTIIVLTNTVGVASSSPRLCMNTALTNITHTTTGATGIGIAIGLPSGVTASWATNTITISGTPTASDTFNYTIPLTGGCGIHSATGKIIVNELPVISITGNTTVCTGVVSTLTAQTNIMAPTQSIPLDEVAGARLAVGLKKLRTAYNGSALRLRRSSDNQEQDFGFAGNDLDQYAIAFWLNGASGYCTKLYDQSGNGGHVSQTNASAQPLLVISGINNNPSLRFTTTQSMFNAVNYPAPFSVIYGSKVIGTSARVLAAKNNNWLLGYWGGSEDRAFFGGWVSEGNTLTVANQFNIYAATRSGSLSTVYKNGTQIASNGNGSTGPNGIQLNGSGENGNTTETSNCEFTDVIVYGSALSASEIAQLSNNISSYQKNTIRYLWSTGANSASIAVNALGNYAVTVTDNYTGCSATSGATPVITGTSINTAGNASSTPSLCINTSLNNITHTTTGASGIGTSTGLPTGVTASWANNTITISGTPTSLGTFNYLIPLTGGCGSVNATGTITVLTTIAGAASSSPTGCINTALTNITHTTIIATGIGIAIGLPSGVTASWATNTITISGTPTQSGIFNYAIPLTGGCNEYSATGTITVNVNDLPTPPTISANGATTFCTGGSVSLNTGSADGLFDEGNALYFYRQYSQYMKYVYVPNYSILNLSPFTMEAWVNYSGANVTIIGNNYFSWKLNAMNDNKLSFYNNSISTEKYSTVAVPQNTWSHVAITLSGGTLTFYINGVAAGTAPVGYGYGNDGINIGKEFNGSMDELRIWNVARSPSDIFASYQTTVPTNSSGLVAYYKFDEGTGTSIADSSNNGNNGTMVNGGPFWQVPSTSPLLLKNIFFTWYNNAAVIGNAQSISATTAGPYTVKITLPSGCSATSGETPITLTSNNTAGNASSTPTICINTSLTDITHTTTGASGIGIPTSLPAGVTASWANNTITISGTPTTRLGNFYYSIPLSGGCGSVNATGTITVITKTAGAASSKPSLCINTSLTNITHTTTGATGIEAATDLPPGVSAAWANNIITISGTPTQSGTFNYNIPLTGGCIAFSATGTITVIALPEVSIAGNTTICAGVVSTLTAQTNIIAPTQSIPLDEVAGAKLAIGLRKLRTAYNGPALRLRRSSDDQEQDFGFEGNNLDVNAISTWLNGASAYCTKLYDQSGNGGDVSQTSVAAQPLLVISGININPILRFTTAQNMFNGVNYPAPFSVIYGSKVIGTSARVLAAKNNNWLLGYWGGSEDKAFFDGWVSSGNTPTTPNQYNIYAATGTGSISTVYKNGVQFASKSNGLTGPDGIQLNGAGYTGNNPTETSNCEFTDIIVYGSALSASEIAQLSNNIRSYQKYPIRYLWSTGANSPSIDVNALGNYAVTVTDNSTGCSASSSVTVKRPSSTLNVSICSTATPYVWNGGSYTSSGVYTPTANSTLGCDSIATLVLTVRATSASTTNVSICSSALPYSWNGINRISSGTHNYITTNSVGCDSTATLVLTVSTPVTPTFTAIAAICSVDSLSALPTTSINNITGSWTPPLNNLETTTYTFTPNLGVCATVASLTIAVPVPTNIVATGINNGGYISFTAPQGTGITNYQYSLDNGANWISPSPAVTRSPLVISNGLNNCTTYQVRLRAVTATCFGPASTQASFTPTNSILPGVNWTSFDQSYLSNNSYSVSYGNGLFVAVGYNNASYSIDGITWTSANTPSSNNSWRSVTYGNGLFVAVAQSGTGNRVMTSSDGVTWTLRTPSANNNWRSITYGNGLFVAISSTGTGNRVMTSPDGVTWTSRTSAANNSWASITFGNGLFVAVSSNVVGNPNPVMTSPDGITWTSRTTQIAKSWRSVTYGNGLFVAISPYDNLTTGNDVMTSQDGITWTNTSSSFDADWHSIAYGNGLFVAIRGTTSGPNDYVTSISSSDGINWTPTYQDFSGYTLCLTYGNGSFVSVGDYNISLISTYQVAANAPSIDSVTKSGSSAVVAFTTSLPTNLESTAVTNFEYSLDNGSTWITPSPTVTTSPLIIENLANGNYQLRIRAVNSIGTSCPSAMTAFTICSNVRATSGTPTVCSNAALTNIIHTTTGITGIGIATGLPAGVTASWANDTIKITGTPTDSGTFNYNIPLAGGCGAISATGTITVKALTEISITGNTTICAGAVSTLTVQSNIIAPTQSIPLDVVAGARLAVGLRKLRTAYNGFALRLRRSSDNQEQDFGFVGNDLDVNAISTWLNGSSAYCTKLYDQSGNGGDVSQTSVAAQPLLVISGINNNPSLRFTTTQSMFNAVNYPAPFSVIYGSKVIGGTSARVLAAKNNNWLLGYWGGEQDRAYFEGWVNEGSTRTIFNQYNIYAATGTGSVSIVYKNGTQIASNGNGLTGPNGIQLNGYGEFGNTTETSNCEFTDVIVYGSALSASEIAQLSNNISSYQNYPIRYLWSTGANSASIDVNALGNYAVTVTNNNTGCSATSSATVKRPSSSTNVSICSSATPYLWNGGSYTSSGVYIHTANSTLGCDSIATLNLTINQPSTSSQSVIACESYVWNGSTYTTSGVKTYITTNSVGCDSVAILNLTINQCTTTLNITTFLEGFYTGNGNMRANLYDLGISTNDTETDSVDVNLWSVNNLSSSTPDFAVRSVLHTNGSLTAVFPGATLNNSYYVALKHRNSIELWSAAPVTIASITNHDFSNSLNSAFSDGFSEPLKWMNGNKYAMFSGDVNQDGTIDLFDAQITENGASNFLFGYYSSDCNGDGSTDLFDLQLIDNNSTLFLFYARPF